ncbi:MAG: adenylate/guanylate cyclase domain-containing protein [Archangium sp.]
MSETTEVRGLSLEGRLAALLVVVTVVPVLVLGWQAIERNRSALTVDAQHFERVMVERAAEAVDRDLESAGESLEAIAQTLGDADGQSQELKSQLAARQLEAWGGSRFVTLYSPEGRRRGSIRIGDATETGAEVLEERLRGDGLAFGEVVQRAQGPVLPLSTPVLGEDGVVRFWLLAELELTPLCKRLAALGELPPLRDASSLFVIDGQRRLVLSGNPSLVTESMSAHPVFEALKGNAQFRQPMTVVTDFTDEHGEMLAAVTTLPRLGWAFVARQSAERAYESLNVLIAALVATIGVTVLVAIALGLLGGRWLVRPLHSLVRATQRIARREWTRVESSVKDRSDEVGTLARAVDTMSASLEKSEAELVQETMARAALARYLPADVVDQVVADPSRLQLGGERRLITVLFADVVGFTQMSEHLPPERIVAVLNEYFTLATEVVHHHGGFIDKFIGDCVMAVWGLPEQKEDDAERAVAAAEALQRWTDACARRWRTRYGVHLQLAMGINTGLVVAGNVGSERRLEYTVIGDPVNVAARLESAAAPGQILLSDSTRVALSGARRLAPLGERQLRGRTQSIRVFEVSR